MSAPHKDLRRLNVLTFFLVMIEGDYSGRDVPLIPIYNFFYAQIISGMPSIAEMVAFTLCGSVLIQVFNKTGGVSLRSTLLRTLLAVGLGVVVSAGLSVLYGLGTGGDFRIAAWQARSFPMFLCWSLIAFRALQSVQDATRFLRVFTMAAILKAVVNIIILFVYFDGHIRGKLGGEEYLSSHIGSFYMGSAVLCLMVRFLFQSTGFKRLWMIAAVLIICYPWVLNDRRVSFMGVTFSLIFSGLFLYPHITKRHFSYILVGLVGALIFVAATWNNPGHSVRSLFVKDPNHEIDYRDIENYNLYRTVAEHPFIGNGYGAPFHQYMELANIFDVAETLSWIPHNNILMIWAFAGPFGLAALGLVIAFAIAAMVRLFGTVADPEVRVFAFLGYAVMVQWTLYFWADMALAWSPAIILPGVVTGFGFKLLALKAPQPAAARAVVRRAQPALGGRHLYG